MKNISIAIMKILLIVADESSLVKAAMVTRGGKGVTETLVENSISCAAAVRFWRGVWRRLARYKRHDQAEINTATPRPQHGSIKTQTLQKVTNEITSMRQWI